MKQRVTIAQARSRAVTHPPQQSVNIVNTQGVALTSSAPPTPPTSTTTTTTAGSSSRTVPPVSPGVFKPSVTSTPAHNVTKSSSIVSESDTTLTDGNTSQQ